MDNKNLEPIKRAIMSGHQRGICDKDGNSVVGPHGILVAKPSNTGSSAKTYVVRNGKLVEKH
ncbi:MAG: hypothetical protein IMZ61_03250 [Planctomycetes bacterium]|nr:hypothetical protein [Planctomycetota bacterium]